MRLIKIRTKGFKSFADEISLNFDGGVVGIVGPNGSGKSNINDAIKWVLGEQSIKSLRGSSADDVIFAGSKLVKASDKAEVSLTFDNSEGLVSIPHKQFTITRILKRGGGSNQYFINGEPARLRDIKEIAMESGIGKSSLAIISQGTISDIAEASPEERRGIFEEAAGISKYKARKQEALRKLSSTSEALEKVRTVVNELDKQLKPLKKQADKAKIFLEKKAELKDVEISLIVKDVEFYSQKFEELKVELEDVVSAKEDFEQRINSSEKEIREKTTYKLSLENEIQDLSTKVQDLSEKIRDIDSRKSFESERRKMIVEGRVKIDDQTRIKAMEDELNDLSSKILKYQVWEEKSTEDIKSKREIVSELQKKSSTLNFEISSLSNKLLKLRTKKTILIDHRDNKTNLFKGVKTIVENKEMFNGYDGLVSELIDVSEENRTAIESILSSALQHIVVKDSSTAVKAVEFLKNNKAGRATFIPLNVIRPKGIVEEHQMIARGEKGFIGIAAELVKTEPTHEILKKFLLGNIIVADTVQSAVEISKKLASKYMVVSLSGDIVRSGGVISGGESQNKDDSAFGLDEQIEKIEKSIPIVESQIAEQRDEYQKIQNILSEEQAITAELNIELAKVREKKKIAEDQFHSMKLTYESQSNKKFENKGAYVEDSADLLESERNSIQALLKAKRESIRLLNEDLASITISKTEMEKSLRAIVESSSDKLSKKSQAEFIITSNRKRLAEEYEMTVELARSEYKLTMDEEKAREIVANLRSQIKELGYVNVESIEAYEEVNDRYTKLKSSEDELFTAQQTIISAIDEMDQIIIANLDATVKGVNEEFHKVFQTMFGGGHAEVRYTDPSNLLETGIDVIAQPPGKTVKNLRLFSGGEKAMIAISLLFAILKSKPLPLCILDEVEAALDDANVVRYVEYLQELKKQTQFVVVTHRVGTMARVDHLFGATMQNRGVTSFFSVKLSEAQKLID